MPDLGWQNYIDAQEKGAWLGSLTVAETEDEFGVPRFFVEDYDGDWIGEAFDTKELAQDAIRALREEPS